MEKQAQIERIETFLSSVILEELDKLQKASLSYMNFVIMGQIIEVLGGFLDQKPMKAKGQSSRRFAQAVRYLFGGRYRLLNENNLLYDKLRNQMTHAFIPGGDLILIGTEKEEGYTHLEFRDKRLVLVATTFHEDIRQACHRLLLLLREGKIKPKNIAFEHDR
ncbi:hypothetical protein [Odoribacter lunatus]|uniref:hypothetical protein n=1 Tax=Odoribacter lunatus TaxID=2941335 RepID=UPI00203B911D|nr:hypothetical protein [Odoribacter lunatus]